MDKLEDSSSLPIANVGRSAYCGMTRHRRTFELETESFVYPKFYSVPPPSCVSRNAMKRTATGGRTSDVETGNGFGRTVYEKELSSSSAHSCSIV